MQFRLFHVVPLLGTAFAGFACGGVAPDELLDEEVDPAPSSQCTAGDVPGPARRAGLTKLAFCDDFSDINKSFELKNGTWSPGKKWNRALPFNFAVASPSSYKVKNGVLEFSPDKSSAQMSFLSSVKVGNQVKGYYTSNREWYAEIRWRFAADQSVSKGFPAFWGMDICHLHKASGQCEYFIEPDFFEYISGQEVTALHHWRILKNRQPNHRKLTSCFRVAKNTGQKFFAPTQWHTRSIHVNPNNSDGVVRYLYNEDRVVAEYNQKSVCRAQDDPQRTSSPAFLKNLKNGHYPIIVGMGPSYRAPLYIDYVRVWVKP